MRSKRKPTTVPASAWAIYMRTSSEDVQNPENSQRRQRHSIERALLSRQPMPLYREYIDNLSGRYADNRPAYQAMLIDARAGHFSHIAIENAERFGRNDTDALIAIDELNQLGISVRFADYPDLDPVGAEDRILISLSFTLARRESMKLSERVKGGLHAKLRSGGSVGKAPDGYLNCEEKTELVHKSGNGKYTRWVEQDPERAHIWRQAWELLLQDQMTLAQICEELHSRGYYLRSGKQFVHISENGKRVVASNILSKIFHNWFYAGWVISEKAGIPPKTVRGQWKPIVSTEDFERGLSILQRRNSHRVHHRRHDYLLQGLLYLRSDSHNKDVRLTGSTSNSGRAGGGTAYYCITRSGTNILCSIVDEQVSQILTSITVNEKWLPAIRASYAQDLTHKLGHNEPSEREKMEKALKAIDSEEARTLRLYASGNISEVVWNNMWAEWQDRRRILQSSLKNLSHEPEMHIRNLDDALQIITKLRMLYTMAERTEQKALLRYIVSRITVDPEGQIVDVKLHAPFAYLSQISNEIEEQACNEKRNPSQQEKQKASTMAGLCSGYVASSTPYETRTRVFALRGRCPGPLDERGMCNRFYHTLPLRQDDVAGFTKPMASRNRSSVGTAIAAARSAPSRRMSSR